MILALLLPLVSQAAEPRFHADTLFVQHCDGPTLEERAYQTFLWSVDAPAVTEVHRALTSVDHTPVVASPSFTFSAHEPARLSMGSGEDAFELTVAPSGETDRRAYDLHFAWSYLEPTSTGVAIQTRREVDAAVVLPSGGLTRILVPEAATGSCPGGGSLFLRVTEGGAHRQAVAAPAASVDEAPKSRPLFRRRRKEAPAPAAPPPRDRRKEILGWLGLASV